MAIGVSLFLFCIVVGAVLLYVFWEKQSGWMGEEPLRVWGRWLGYVLLVAGCIGIVILYPDFFVRLIPRVTWS